MYEYSLFFSRNSSGSICLIRSSVKIDLSAEIMVNHE